MQRQVVGYAGLEFLRAIKDCCTFSGTMNDLRFDVGSFP